MKHDDNEMMNLHGMILHGVSCWCWYRCWCWCWCCVHAWLSFCHIVIMHVVHATTTISTHGSCIHACMPPTSKCHVHTCASKRREAAVMHGANCGRRSVHAPTCAPLADVLLVRQKVGALSTAHAPQGGSPAIGAQTVLVAARALELRSMTPICDLAKDPQILADVCVPNVLLH